MVIGIEDIGSGINMSMCINCKGIESIKGEDYCYDCIIDMIKVEEDKNGNEVEYCYCIYCGTWYNLQDGHRCWRV